MARKSLMESNHTPSLEELRAFFKQNNDFSAAVFSDRDYATMPLEAAELMVRVKAEIDAHWDRFPMRWV